MAETRRNVGDIADYIGLVGNNCQCIRFYRDAEHRHSEHHLSSRRHRLDSTDAPIDDLDGDGIFPRATSSLELERSGASDGARTRDLRRDRPAL